MLKIGVVDDHQLIRRSLSLLVNTFDGIEVVIEADNGRDLLQKLESTTIDVALLDIQMPIMNGFETCSVLQRDYPKIKVLAVSHLEDKESLHKILDSGAHGCFSKNSDPEQLEIAIRKINDKGIYFDSELSAILHQVIFWDKKPLKIDNPLASLTPKELMIVKFLSQGLDNNAIASKLFVNIRTVETYRKRIMEKAAVKNFTAVIMLALKFHYISVDDL